MSSLTINLDPVAMREATTQAIMGILTPDVRERILQDAIYAVLKPSTDSWDRGISPIQRAFNEAVSSLAYDMAKEHVKNDPSISVKLKLLVEETANRILGQDVDKLSEKMADSFVRSIERDR